MSTGFPRLHARYFFTFDRLHTLTSNPLACAEQVNPHLSRVCRDYSPMVRTVKPGGESLIAAGAWCPGKNELQTIRYIYLGVSFPLCFRSFPYHHAGTTCFVLHGACAVLSRHLSLRRSSGLHDLIRRVHGRIYSALKTNSRSRLRVSRKRTSKPSRRYLIRSLAG